MSSAELSCRVQSRDETTAVELTGRLGTADYGWLRDRLLKEAAELPKALIADVDGLLLGNQHALSVLSYVANRIAEWPGIPFLLVASRPPMSDVLARSAIRRFVSVYDSVQAAVGASDEAPIRQRVLLRLPNDPISSLRARRFCAETCREWDVDTVSEDAKAIVAELIENAVQHTTSDALLRLELRRNMLSISVTDENPKHPVLREGSAASRAGHGLRIVAQLGKAWGCADRFDGGKVIWAVLTTGPFR